MEKWTKEQIKEKGKELILSAFGLAEQENYIDEETYLELFKEFSTHEIHETKESIELHMLYLKTASNIIYLYRTGLQLKFAFEYDNKRINLIVDELVMAEKEIFWQSKYNELLSAIPREVKKQIATELTKKTNVKNSIKNTTNLNFMLECNREERFTSLIKSCTKYLATGLFVFFITTSIGVIFDVPEEKCENICSKFLFIGNDDYLAVCKIISKLFEYSDRLEDFNETKMYKTLYKYIHLSEKVEELQKKKTIATTLKKKILAKESADKILKYLDEKLYEESEWSYEEQTNKKYY